MPYLTILQFLLSAIKPLTEAYVKVKEAARQNAELTPEQESELAAQEEAAFKQDYWKPEA